MIGLKTVCLLAILVSCLFLVSPLPTANNHTSIFVYGQESTDNQTGPPPVERELTIDRSYYLELKIMISYPYTNDHDVTDITTIGNPRYSHDVQPDSLVFLTQDVDVFTFTLHIQYANATWRSIMMTTWEGDRAPQGETWSENAADFVIHFRITTLQQPTYPSAQEVANETFLQFEQMYIEQLEEQRAATARLEATEFRNSIVSLITVCVAFAAFIWTGFAYYRQRKEVGS